MKFVESTSDPYSNPKDYNENEDARPFDNRLRGPVRDIELQIDMQTGMKNYIAKPNADWATSAAYVKYSFERSIHHGRQYTNGRGIFKGKDEELAEALRYLGQGLHTLEDFGAHTNYVELSLRELGFNNVFPHVGTATAINLHGKHVFPLVTGTFGTVDFYHSVLGEATDHFTQSEVNEMDNALGTAQQAAQSSSPLTTLVKLLSKVPGTKDLCDEAERLQASSQAQARSNEQGFGGQGSRRGVDEVGQTTRGVNDWDSSRAPHAGFPSQPQGYGTNSWNAPPQQNYQQPGWGQPQPQWQDQGGSQSFNPQGQPAGGYQNDWQNLQGVQRPVAPQQAPQQSSAPNDSDELANFDPSKTIAQIYPILAFRDKVVRTISSIIEKIPGLEALVERITETLTVFILSLLAPFVRPILNGVKKTLQSGSESVVNSSGKHQYEVWTNPNSSDPTHSMLSKDHFSNILNEPAGSVAAEILKFIAPRVLYAWEHPNVPLEQVMQDVDSIFHHPAIRNERIEVHRTMFTAVKQWIDHLPDRGRNLNDVLSSEGVRSGKNHKEGAQHSHGHQSASSGGQQSHGSAGLSGLASFIPGQQQQQQHGGGGNQSSSPFGMVGDVIGNFSGHGSQSMQQHSGSGGSGGGGGLSSMLHMANKLPIPGVQNVTSSLNKYTKFMGGFGGGKRGLDDTDEMPAGPGGGELGGYRELHEAAILGDQTAAGKRDPSPMPMAPPSGYEQFGQQSTGDYGYGQEGQGYQHQSSYQDSYRQGQSGQGESAGYYGGGR